MSLFLNFISSAISEFYPEFLPIKQTPKQVENALFFGRKFTGKELDAETGYGYFGARYMDHELMTMWLSVDPMADKYPGISPYAYCTWNPVKLIDPDGESPISVLAKMVAKRGMKVAVRDYAKKQIENRLKNYMSKNIAKQFAKDLDDVLSIIDNSWWEIGLELIPVVGDIYGGTKFGLKVAKAYNELQRLENKYVEKIYNSLPKSEKERFKKAMRNAGVRDARVDQSNGVEGLGVRHVKGRQIDGHHKKPVSEDISQSSDPRNIEFMPHQKHQEIHSKQNTTNND